LRSEDHVISRDRVERDRIPPARDQRHGEGGYGEVVPTNLAIDTIATLKPAVQQWVRGWMQGPAASRCAAELGLRDGEQIWIVGRAGVLGDGDAAVAAAGLAFLAPDRVRGAWDSLPAPLTPRTVAAAYAQLACDWGDSELPRFGDATLERLNALGRRVVDAADGSLGTVFAGWRAMPEPAPIGARVALTMHVVRELRGAAHIVALHATGLTPLQAVLASPAAPPRTGAPWAEHLGWTGPFADPALFVTARAEAEDLTNRILAPAFGALDAAELAEFAELCTSVRNAIEM
jgi:hypothetical protein